jgi:peptidoglycan/xylan/chitin deacetylase (PgdA/CDA1 family)
MASEPLTLACTVGESLSRRWGQPAGHVLFYHGVIDAIADPILQRNHILIEEFRRHVAWARRHRVPVSAAEVRAALRGDHTLPRGWLLFTFDDGYQNNAGTVADILGDVPWLVYLATDFVDRGGRMPSFRMRRTLRALEGALVDVPSLGVRFDCRTAQARAVVEANLMRRLMKAPRALHDALLAEVEAQADPDHLAEWDARFPSEAPMTWDDARALARAGVAIGGHTHRHTLLHPRQTEADVREEIEACAARIEAELGVAPADFCWPNGTPADLSFAAISALGQSAFEWATTTSVGQARLGWADRWLVPRIPAVRLETMLRWMFSRALIPWEPPRPTG